MLFVLKIVDQYFLRSGVLEAVVRAGSESEARSLVYKLAEHDMGCEEWLDASKSTCEPLDPNGESEVIIAEIELA